MNIVGETSKHVGTFFDALKTAHPLSLALVVMNFVLLGFLFYSGSSQLSQRRETVDLIIKWQTKTDQLMASCVSSEIMQMVLQALKQNGFKPPEPPRP